MSGLEQGWNHENTFVPFLGMSVFFYFERRCSKMKQFVRTEITTTCMVKKQLIGINNKIVEEIRR